MSNNAPAHNSITKSIVGNADFNNVNFALLTSNMSVSTVEDDSGGFMVNRLSNSSDFDITINSGDINCVFAAVLSFTMDASDACVGSFDIAATNPVIKLTDEVLSNYSSVMSCDDQIKLELLAQVFHFNIEDGSIPIELTLKQTIVMRLNQMLQDAIEQEDEDCFIVKAVKELTAEAIDNSSNALDKFLLAHQG